MALADTPRAVAAASEIVFSCLTDGTAVRAVALGDDGIIAGLRPGCVYLDMSTIAPDASRAVAAEFAAKGLVMLDAPISGSPVTLAQGNASVMVGGDKAAFERVEPVLRAIGPKVTHIGESGMAVQMKIAVNLLSDGRGDRVRRGGRAGREGRRRSRGGGRRHSEERRRLAGARLSRAVHPGRQDAGRCRLPT